MVALAQSGFDDSYITGFLQSVLDVINDWLIPIVIGVALLYFLWGVMKYVTSGGDPGARKEAANTMLYGIIALAVMVSVWGLVGLLQDIAGVDSSGGADILPPVVPGTSY